MSAREIRHLRNKFIAVAMLSLFLAMLFIGVMVNIITYTISRTAVNRSLDVLIKSEEDLERRERVYGFSFSDVFFPGYDSNAFYVLRFDENGELTRLHSNTQDSREEEMIREYASVLRENGRRGGQYHGYYFRCKGTEDGEAVIAFLDGSDIISTELRTIFVTVLLCALGLIITFFLVRHFSEQAIRPEVENSMRQRQFITNASHELKTPLAVIRANTDMVEMTQGESEWTQSTLKQIDHLNGLIQNLVMITRSQEQEDRSELSEIDAAQIVSETLDPYESLAGQTGKTILREIAEQVRITADGSKLRQLVTILIDNALKYCDDKGTIRVKLDAARGGKGLTLTVSNDYQAGAQLDCSRFFDRFYREDASHNIDRGGYGIGLSIAQSICEGYGGSIHAEWKDGVISFVCRLK